MADGEIVIKLGALFLPYCSFRWPKYRGTVAKPVELDCPAQMYPALVNLAKGQPIGGWPLSITGPGEPGKSPTDATVVINGAWIDRVALHDQVCRLTLFDTRFLLGRRVADVDFRIVFGDGYLEGTDYNTLSKALDKLRDSIPLLGLLTTPAFSEKAPLAYLRDGTYLSGQSLPQGLGALLDAYNADLTMHNDGMLYTAGRGDIADSDKLPRADAYKWTTQPSWHSKGTYISGKPSTVVAYYPERHCIRMLYEGGDGTVAHAGPRELRVELEQVYADDGEYVTLDELLSNHDFTVGVDLTDTLLATCIMSDTFENAPIHDAYGTEEFNLVHKAVQDGWRRLFRVKFVDSVGHVGGWKDWAAGKIASDGSIIPVAVDCPWVEFLNVVQPNDSTGSNFLESVTTVNHESPSPFTVRFEGDGSSGVIRLVQKDLRDGNLAIPGALTAPLKVAVVNKLQDGEGDVFSLNDYKLIESESRGKARFDSSFTMAVYMCATRMMPNSEARWHAEQVATGLADADISFIELPPSSELVCVRDYVNASEAGHGRLGDGLGVILNQTALAADASQRSTGWILTHCAELEGFGLAESVMLFRDFEVDGPINELVLEVDITETSATVRTRITAGNLADLDARGRLATSRLAKREWKERGTV